MNICDVSICWKSPIHWGLALLCWHLLADFFIKSNTSITLAERHRDFALLLIPPKEREGAGQRIRISMSSEPQGKRRSMVPEEISSLVWPRLTLWGALHFVIWRWYEYTEIKYFPICVFSFYAASQCFHSLPPCFFQWKSNLVLESTFLNQCWFLPVKQNEIEYSWHWNCGTDYAACSPRVCCRLGMLFPVHSFS